MKIKVTLYGRRMKRYSSRIVEFNEHNWQDVVGNACHELQTLKDNINDVDSYISATNDIVGGCDDAICDMVGAWIENDGYLKA